MENPCGDVPPGNVSADDKRVNLYNNLSNNELPLLSEQADLKFAEGVICVHHKRIFIRGCG